jgi:NitT/TauT family transport system permease protein
MKDKNKTRFQKALAVLTALCAWQAVAMIVNNRLLLASPVSVIGRLYTVFIGEGFAPSVWFSFSRITLGFLIALLSGTVLAVAAGRFRVVETLLWPYMITIKSVPVASFIVLSLIWFTSQTLSAFTSFLMVLPIIYTNVLEGVKSVDARMTELAEVFRVPWKRRLVYIWIPQIKPFLISGCSVSFGLSWKAGIAAEVIGIPEGSIGEKLYYAKVYLNSADLLAWTLIIVIMSIIFEKLFVFLLKRGFNRLEKL